jgi:predicted secreted protein
MTWRNALSAAIVGLTWSLTSACSSHVPATQSGALPRELTAADAGTVVELERGQVVIVQLPANRTTGYTWVAELEGDPVLLQQGPSRYVVAESQDSNAVGAGGTEIFTFVANGVGEQVLEFQYRRPWEKNVQPVRKQSYRVAVRP